MTQETLPYLIDFDSCIYPIFFVKILTISHHNRFFDSIFYFPFEKYLILK